MMEIEIELTRDRIRADNPGHKGGCDCPGALAEFSGVVRGMEGGEPISALEYEAYSPMAEREMRRIVDDLARGHPCMAVRVIHRIGVIPVGETAIFVRIAALHRGEAFALLAAFMDRLKQDVPIWKVRAIPAGGGKPEIAGASSALTLDEACGAIESVCSPLPGMRVPLDEAFGRVLRASVSADGDLPASDLSTRDGYAILQVDDSPGFRVVDTLHAADSRPRQLGKGQTVRVATGASLPCADLRVVMQEDVERDGDVVKIVRWEKALNIRKRGSEMRAGEVVVPAGRVLNAGALSVLAAVGCAIPLVSPRLRVVHFTTGDEIVPPESKPGPGQVRDSNSILVASLLRNQSCDVSRRHLPEDFDLARARIAEQRREVDDADLILVSGGASVGEKDFTRPLLEWLGFEIRFSRTNIRPGAPLIFGVSGTRAAFGLPGNPLSHFVCFHMFVAAAITALTGGNPPAFQRGRIASRLDEPPNPRETLWPAWHELRDGVAELHALPWKSSGDVTALLATNALIRIPPGSDTIRSGTRVEFLPTET